VTDGNAGRIVLFGGVSLGSVSHSDTWEWNGSSWKMLSAAASPDARSFHSMAWDPLRQVALLFGGQNSACSPTKYYRDTWEWNGVTWKDRVSTPFPSARSGAALAFDSLRERMVLMGGESASVPKLSDTWEWDGNSWVQANPWRSPGALSRHGMAYDESRQRIVALADTGLAWDYGLVESAASYQEFGPGCAGSGGVPGLATAPGTGPWIGEQLTINLTNLPAGQPAFLLFGSPIAPVSLGFLGIPASCSLHVSPDVALPASNGTPSFSVSFALPSLCALIGQRLGHQIFALDAAGSGGAVSPGVLMVFGVKPS
jgi:hypothetical protein